jgi:hypothetical protein
MVRTNKKSKPSFRSDLFAKKESENKMASKLNFRSILLTRKERKKNYSLNLNIEER